MAHYTKERWRQTRNRPPLVSRRMVLMGAGAVVAVLAAAHFAEDFFFSSSFTEAEYLSFRANQEDWFETIGMTSPASRIEYIRWEIHTTRGDISIYEDMIHGARRLGPEEVRWQKMELEKSKQRLDMLQRLLREYTH